MKFFEEITAILEQDRLTGSSSLRIGKEGDPRGSSSGRFLLAGTEISCRDVGGP